MKKTIPCIARCADGTTCGRRIPLGTTPQVCHLHRGAHPGAATQFTRKDKSPEQILDELMHSKDETVRLRAVDTYLKRLERQTACPKCQADASADRDKLVAVRRLTYEQRCQIRELKEVIDGIIEMARTQAMTWDEDRQLYLDAPEVVITAPPPIIAAEPVFEEEESEDGEEEEPQEEDDRDPLRIPPDE